MYDIEQIKELLKNLEFNVAACSESEKALHQYLNTNAHYIENEQALNTLLKACIKIKRGNGFEVNSENIDKVYNILRTNLFISQKPEFDDEHVYSSQINELAFFKFVFDLYADANYVRSRDKDVNVSKDITNSLVSILCHYADKFAEKEADTSNDEAKKVETQDFYVNKQKLLHKAIESIPYIEASSRLKQAYCKDIEFFVDADVELLRKLSNNEYIAHSKIENKIQKAAEKIQTKFNDTKLIVQHDKTSSKWFAFTGLNLVCSTALYQLDNMSLVSLSILAGVNLGGAATSVSGALDNTQRTLINTRYELKKHTSYQKVLNHIRRNLDEFDQFKEALYSTKDQSLNFLQFHKCAPKLSSHFQKLTLELHQAKQEKNAELKQLYRSRTADDHYQEFSLDIKEALKYFIKFDDKNQDKLRDHMRISKEFSTLVKKFVESNQTLNQKHSSISTFDSLLQILTRNSAKHYLSTALNQTSSYQTFQPSRAYSI